MKFRSKWIIGSSIIAFFTLFFLGTLIDMWTLYIFLLVLAIYIIAIFFRYNNYIELDDDRITQVKYNLLLKKTIKTISYKDIAKIEFGKNHTLSQVDVWEDKHYIHSASWETIKIWKIFHLKKFKNILDEKRYLMTQCIINNDIIKWEKYSHIPNIFGGNTFISYEWFLKLDNEKMVISKNYDWKYKIFNIKYQDIDEIEVVIVEEDNTCIYIKLKNQKLKEVFYGIKDWNAFMNAINNKWINAHFVSSDEIISDLKEEDLY